MDYPCSISLSFNSRICTIYLPLLPLKRKRYVFLKFEVHKIKGSKNWKKNPCKTICIQNGKYEAIKWPQNYSWKNVNVCVFWWYVMIGICRWGNISFHKIQRYYGHILKGSNLIRIQNNSSIISYFDLFWYTVM